MTSNLLKLGRGARAAWPASLISGDAVGTTVTRVLIIGFGLASNVVTSRLLLPAGRGEYFWVVTMAQLIVQGANLGLHSSSTYLVARDHSHLRALLANALTLSVVLGGGGAALVAAVLPYWFTDVPASLWVIVALVPALLLQLFTANLLVGVQDIRTFNVVQLISNVAVMVAIIAAGAGGLTAGGFLVLVTLAWSATGLWAATLVARRAGLRWPAPGFDRTVFVEGLSFAARAYIATLCGFMVLRMSVFSLKAYAGYQAVGYFSVAAQVGDVLAIFPQSVALVLFPALVSIRSNAWERTLRQATAVALILGVACVMTAFAAPTVVPAIFGEAFRSSVSIVWWVLPGAFCTGVTSVVSQYAAAAGFPKALVGIWVGGLLVAVTSSYLLVPTFGGVGAAAALSLTQALILASVLTLCFHLERRQVDRPAEPVATS